MKNLTFLVIIGLVAGSLSGCATSSSDGSDYQPGVNMNLAGARAGYR